MNIVSNRTGTDGEAIAEVLNDELKGNNMSERTIDSKYKIVVNCNRCKVDERPLDETTIKIVNFINGNEIPEDEPLFIFRAKDNLSLGVLTHYLYACIAENCTKEQISSLQDTINRWILWQLSNKDKLKQPGSTMPEDLKKKSSGSSGFGAPNDGK